MKLTDKAVQGMVSESPGRNASEPTGVDFRAFPRGKDLLLVGKLLQVGQACKDFLAPRAPLTGGHH